MIAHGVIVRHHTHLCRLLSSAVVLCAVILLTLGCAATDAGRRDSDMPWNEPQPWEGSPYIPGMDRY